MTIQLIHGDCLDVDWPQVDAIITDVPYGVTACKWDSIIPFEPMWAKIKSSLKPRGAFVTTASQPFTSALVMSNPKWFKYEWILQKKYHTNPFLAKRQPLRKTENILVFSNGNEKYNPQMIKRPEKWMRKIVSIAHKNGAIYGNKSKDHPNSGTKEFMYPSNVLCFDADNPFIRKTIHPTQKPVALYEYLIKTYTNEGDTVLDFCMGSGTTGQACINTGRNFIGIEKELKYFEIGQERMRLAQK